MLQTTNLKAEGFGTNYAAFSEKDVDDRINGILEKPLEDQPAAWNELDKYIADKYFPLIPTLYTGVAQAHGSKIMGHYDDNVYGQPTLKTIWIKQ